MTTATPTAPDLSQGIPQSSAFDSQTIIGPHPWEVEEADYQQQISDWQREQVDKLDNAALDPAGFFSEADFSSAPDPDRTRRETINDAALAFYLDREPDMDTTSIQRRIDRQEAAIRFFDGRGADSEEAFHAELVGAATRRRERKEIVRTLAAEGSRAALVAAVDPSKPQAGWPSVRATIAAMPGWTDSDEADLAEAFRNVQQATHEAMAAHADPLAAVWQAFTTGGDSGEAARAAYDALPSHDERMAFLASLRMLADTLPKEQQPAFWQNLRKQTGRDVSNFASDAATGSRGMILEGGRVGWEDFLGSNEAIAKRNQEDRETYQEFRRRADFLADVRTVEQQEFDPVKTIAPDESWAQVFERAAYAAPGAIITSASAAIPGIGMPAFYASSREMIYQQFRQEFEAAGMSYEEAAGKADTLAPIAAVPQVLAERLQVRAFAGKLPILEKVIASASSRMTSTAGRFAGRAAVGAIEEGLLEKSQDIIPFFVQDVAAALDNDIPDVVWRNGRDGVLDGFWKDSAEMVLTMLPLAIIGAGRAAFSNSQRVRTAEAATDDELMALGGSPEKVAAFRMAGSMESKADALDAMVDELDPAADTAKEATARLETLAAERQRAADSLRRSGVFPEIVQTRNGYEVLDGETGELAGTAPDMSGAVRIAVSHSAAFDDRKAEKTAYLATMLEAGEAALAADPQAEGRNVFELGKLMTEATAEAEDPGQIDRFHREARDRELVNGGSGDVSMVALGKHSEELRGTVREWTNRFFRGSSVTTVFHELWHGLWRKQQDAGTITRDEAVAFVRAVDQALAGRTLRRGVLAGESLRLIPEGTGNDQITDAQLEEALAAIAEMEILRTRKRAPGSKAVPIGAGVISRNLLSLSSLAPGATEKFRSLLESARGIFGLASARALALRKAEREGRFDATAYQEFLARFTGTTEQAAHDAAMAQEQAGILGGTEAAREEAGAQETAQDDEGDPFALAPARMVESLELNAAARIQDPETKAAVFSRMLAKLGVLKRDRDEIGSAFGRGYRRDAIDDPRTLRSIRREAAFREAARRAELEDEAHARHAGILENEDVAKLKQQPVHAYLADPDSPLRGRLMSPTVATGRGLNFFDPETHGDFDGAGDVSRSVFGGSLMPDQAAHELFEEGLISAPTPDAMWQALTREAANVERMKRYMRAAREDVRRARQQAKEEAKAWEAARIEKEAVDFSPRARLLRALATLDAILSVLPAEVRGRIGGYTTLARLGSDEARLDFLNQRIAIADTELAAWMKREHREELAALVEKARPIKAEPGEARRGKIGVEAHRIFSWLEQYAGMTEAEVEAERAALAKLEEQIREETVPGIVHPEALSLANRARVLELAGNFAGQSVADQAAALEWLRNTYRFGRDDWQAKEADRLAAVAELQRTIIDELARQKGVTLPTLKLPTFDARKVNGMTPAEAEPILRAHETKVSNAMARHKAALRKALEEGGVGSLAARQQRAGRESREEIRTSLEAGTSEFLSFVQVLERLLGPGHPLVTRWNDAVGVAQAQKTDAILSTDKAWLEAVAAALGNPGKLAVQETLWRMSTEQSVTISKAIREPGVSLEVALADVPGILDGSTDHTAAGLTAADLPALRQAYDEHLAEVAGRLKKDGTPKADTAEFLKFTTPGQRTRHEVNLTPMQAITLALIARQSRYAPNLELHGFTADVIEAAREQIGAEGMEIVAWLADYYRDHYEPIAALYRDMFGVDLPQEENYSPFRAEHAGTDKEIGGPADAGMIPEGGFRANFTRTRAPSHSLAPALVGAASVFQGHVASTEHWRAFAPLVRELKAVLGGLETRHAIEAVHGSALLRALDGWILAFEQNGLRQRKMHDGVDKLARAMQRNIAVLGLAFRISTLAKNYVLPAFGVARRIGLRNYAAGMARFLSGRIGYRRFRNAGFITRREAAGFSQELRLAVAKVRSEKPGRRRNAIIWAMEEIGRADARSTAIGAAISWDHHYRENLARDMSHQDAAALADRQAEDDVRRTAQPVELAERSLYELSSSDMERLLFLFATDARKESAAFFEATRRAWKMNGAAGLLTNAEFRRTALAIWFTGGFLNTVISRVLMDAMDGGEDDEWLDARNWSPASVLASTLLGPLGGVPLVRDLVSGFSQGEMTKAIRAMGAFSDLAEAAFEWDIPDEKRVMWIERRINRILIGFGLFNRAAAEWGAFSNAADQAARIIENAAE